MLHSEMLRYSEYEVWVCLMGLIMPQTVLCQAELMDLWTLVTKQNLIIPVSVAGGAPCHHVTMSPCRQVGVCR